MDSSKSVAFMQYVTTGTVNDQLIGESPINIDKQVLIEQLSQRIKHYLRELRGMTMQEIGAQTKCMELHTSPLRPVWAMTRAIWLFRVNDDPWSLERAVNELYLTRDGQIVRLTYDGPTAQFIDYDDMALDEYVEMVATPTYGNVRALLMILKALSEFSVQNRQAAQERLETAQRVARSLSSEYDRILHIYK